MAELILIQSDLRKPKSAGPRQFECNDWVGPIQRLERRGTTMVVRLASSQAALWSAAGARGFRAALAAISSRADIASIVLHGHGAFDVSGEDDLDAAAAVVAAADACSVPLFAALDGPAIGSGLELALACSGRVATERSVFAMPAVLAGRLPINGGVQRLQALIGPDSAARLLVFGETLNAAIALSLGLIDGMVADGATKLAVALANSHDLGRASALSRPFAFQQSDDLPSVRYQIQSRSPGQSAPMAAVQAMEAALSLPARRSTREIRKISARLEATDQAEALRHAAGAERALEHRGTLQASRIPALAVQLAWPMRREAIHLLDEGASPAQIDHHLIKYGFSRALFSESDRLGMASVFSSDGAGMAVDRAWLTYSPTLDFMVDAGRAGGSQPGWFRPHEDALRFDPEVEHILVAAALFRRVPRRRKTDVEVDQRLFQAMIAGSIELLLARAQLSWRDVDALWTSKLGFPRWRGGPLFQGAKLGWDKVRANFNAADCRRTMGAPGERLERWAAGEMGPPRIQEERSHPSAEAGQRARTA